jgi:CubicO group peptidase (beta-lactamase class C family)
VISAIDAYLASYLQLTGGPGFSCVVVQDGTVLMQKGYGMAVAGGSQAMTADTTSAIGSLTKSFTCLAILQLADRGLLKLDDPVIRHLPWFRTANKAKSDRITLRMLMAHTSGLPALQDTWGQPESTDDSAIEALVRRMSTVQLASDPGVGFRYTNEGYTILGLVISTVARQSYSDYLARNILEPLEMTQSSNDRATLDRLGALTGHSLGVDSFIPALRMIRTAYAPGGSMLSCSARDVGHYLQMILAGGIYKGQRLVSKALFAEWLKPETTMPGLEISLGGDGKDGQYAKGWQLNEDEGAVIINHGGITGTMSSMTMFDPQAGVGVGILFTYGYLDAWRFPTGINLGYNLLRLAKGQALSSYGIPRLPNKDLAEPFIPLPQGYDQRLVGNYVSEAGGKAKIYTTSRGLEVALEQFSFHEFYRLDFVNPGRGVGTSLAVPRPFHLAWNADQSLRFLDIGGNRLYPSKNSLPQGVVLEPLPGTPIQLALPQSLVVSTNTEGLEARGQVCTFTAAWVPKRGLKPGDFTAPNGVIEEGPGFLETVQGQTFNEKNYRIGDQQRLLVVLAERGGGTLVMRLVAPEKQASVLARTVMGVVLAHSRW